MEPNAYGSSLKAILHVYGLSEWASVDELSTYAVVYGRQQGTVYT